MMKIPSQFLLPSLIFHPQAPPFEKIILRFDFFPDISKQRDCLDGLQSVRRHDTIAIGDTQLKIVDSRRLSKLETATSKKVRRPETANFDVAHEMCVHMAYDSPNIAKDSVDSADWDDVFCDS
ncbi:UNVERIFIED_CONTAM: hypothetical protein Sangu_0373700 [Sesamum angustifolium]|uniref:Uncharacterized protein n=1 Tax=Sesamum angustifolium TaxID=2727405 RepID=A0AAW2QT85_9LAMI